jgi:hypothetical protein
MYGWAEGPWHAIRLVRELEARGLTVVDDVATADIIFAHSAGCYQIPKDVRAGLVLLAGLPYGPTHHLVFRLGRKLVMEFRSHYSKHELGWWVNKLLRNGWYIVTRPRATYGMLAKYRLENLPSS